MHSAHCGQVCCPGGILSSLSIQKAGSTFSHVISNTTLPHVQSPAPPSLQQDFSLTFTGDHRADGLEDCCRLLESNKEQSSSSTPATWAPNHNASFPATQLWGAGGGTVLPLLRSKSRRQGFAGLNPQHPNLTAQRYTQALEEEQCQNPGSEVTTGLVAGSGAATRCLLSPCFHPAASKSGQDRCHITILHWISIYNNNEMSPH